MNESCQLIGNNIFKGREYLIKMGVVNSKILEITVTDKQSAEEWLCAYDATYIETLTHKTGNYKQFEVFVAMLKSGLLKTSEAISLDLLTSEDLEVLRFKSSFTCAQHSTRTLKEASANKRYLILTYSVEFDRIHYPLPMEYSGHPDAAVLQAHIKRLEAQVDTLKKQKPCNVDMYELQNFNRRITILTEENELLTKEIRRLNKSMSRRNIPKKQNEILESSLRKLEDQVLKERNQFKRTVWKLREEKEELLKQIEELKKSERYLKVRLKNATDSRTVGSLRCTGRLASQDLNEMPVRDVKNTRSKPEIHLSCRPISSWSTVLKETEGHLRHGKRGSSRRSSSHSSSDVAHLQGKKGSTVGFKEHLQGRDLRGSYQADCLRPVRRIARSRSNSDRSETFGRQSGVRSRASSYSSASSKGSRTKTAKLREQSSDVRRKCKRKSRKDNDEGFKFSISDLETRIKSIQNLLNEGLVLK